MLYGLTCISEILRDQNKEWRFRTMTRKRFNELDYDEAIGQLSERILFNMQHAKRVVEHCHSIGVVHYRIPSCYPLMTDPTLGLEWNMLPNYKDILIAMKDVGDTARKLNIRIGSHPDQFVILCSPRQDVCDKAIVDLNMTSWFFDQMGLPQSYDAPINIHLNSSAKPGNSFQDILNRFYNNLMKCDIGVQKRLVIENEDKSTFDCSGLLLFHVLLLDVFDFKIPLTWDNLHHKCNPPEDVDETDEWWLWRFKETWPTGIMPVMHWSEGGKNGKIRSHEDYITENVGKPFDNTCIWELEVKAKDKAIVQLLNG